jgi:hypothetical protein
VTLLHYYLFGRKCHCIIMSEWVSGCCLAPTRQFFSYIMAKKRIIFNKMMMRFVLYLINMLSWIYFRVSPHWKNSPRIYMSAHSDTLSWFWANQAYLWLTYLRVKLEQFEETKGVIRSNKSKNHKNTMAKNKNGMCGKFIMIIKSL